MGGGKGMVVVHVYHKSGDEFFVLFQFESEDTRTTLYDEWCKKRFGKMTKEKTTKADEKIFTFLRLGCVWSKDLPDCKLFFEDQETYKSKKIKTAQLEVCKDFFEKRLMTKSIILKEESLFHIKILKKSSKSQQTFRICILKLKMTKEKTTKADEKIFTSLRLGCVWSKDLPDCKLFFEDQETYKSKKIKTAQLEVCKDFFEKRLMTKSDNLEIEVKNRIDKEYNI